MTLDATRMRARVDLQIMTLGQPRPERDLGEFDLRGALSEALGILEETAVEAGLGGGLFERAAQLRDGGETVTLTGLRPFAVEWERNPPGEADTFSVVIPQAALPIDLRLIRAVFVSGWIWSTPDPRTPWRDEADQRQPGGAGYFAGVADSVTEDDPETLATLTFGCRDFTALPLEHDVQPATLEGLDLDRPLWECVQHLIRGMPGGSSWVVVPRGRHATSGSPAELLAEEREEKTKPYQRVNITRTEQFAQAPKSNDPPSLFTGPPPDGTVFLLDPGRDEFRDALGFNEQEDVVPLNNAVERDPLVYYNGQEVPLSSLPPALRGVLPPAQQPQVGLVKTADAIAITTENVPSRIFTRRVPPTWQDLFGVGKLKTWEAITRLSGYLGAVAEVGITQGGQVGIWVVDGVDYHQGQALRPFSRDGRDWRRLRLGIDAQLGQQKRDLDGGTRYDAARVTSIDPDTGRVLVGLYGRPGRHGATRDRVLHLVAHGITQQRHLDHLARVAWLAKAQGEFTATATVNAPWSTGGGLRDPDLLDLGAGAVVELVPDQRRGQSTADVLRRAGLPDEAVATLASAAEKLAPSVLFSVGAVRHQVDFTGDDHYQCAVSLRTFLDDGAVPASGTETESAKALEGVDPEDYDTGGTQ